MSLTDGIFTSAIRNTLNEPAVRMVNFTAGGVRIGTMHLMIVSGSIASGAMRCKIDPSKVSAGAAAVYSVGDKTIYGLKAEGFYPDDKQTFVHECTHAAVHLMGFGRDFTIKTLNDETAAFLAGAIYVVASGQLPNTLNLKATTNVAYRIASTKGIVAGQTNAGSPIAFTDQELVPLHNAIKASPLYRNWNQDTKLRW